MKAVWYDEQGEALTVLRFGDLPTPEPAAGELRVRLYASSVNPADANRRAGRRHPMDFPRIIPNSDGAGVVDAVGEGVDPNRIGQRVWLYFAQRDRPFGTAAEYVCLPQGLASPMPDALDFDSGACLGVPCMTAWCALFGDGGPPPRRVLVTGGAGAVGHYAVQLAKWSGAQVVATARSESRAIHARLGGADVVIDPLRADLAAGVLEATDGRGVDRIVDVDAAAHLEAVLRCASDGATWVSYAVGGHAAATLPFVQLIRKNLRLHGLYLSGLDTEVRQRAQSGVNRWLAEVPGGLHQVDRRFTLRDTALAHRTVEQGGKLGTVIVRCASESGS